VRTSNSNLKLKYVRVYSREQGCFFLNIIKIVTFFHIEEKVRCNKLRLDAYFRARAKISGQPMIIKLVIRPDAGTSKCSLDIIVGNKTKV
jgi:hypothetical protein